MAVASARTSSGTKLRRDGRTPSLWRNGVTERVSRAAAATEESGRKRCKPHSCTSASAQSSTVELSAARACGDPGRGIRLI